jgi:hypothetical protein
MSRSAVEYVRHILDETGYFDGTSAMANLGSIYAR